MCDCISRFRTLLLGLTLAAVASFTTGCGFTSTALSMDDAQVSAGTLASVATCCGNCGGVVSPSLGTLASDAACCGNCVPNEPCCGNCGGVVSPSLGTPASDAACCGNCVPNEPCCGSCGNSTVVVPNDAQVSAGAIGPAQTRAGAICCGNCGGGGGPCCGYCGPAQKQN